MRNSSWIRYWGAYKLATASVSESYKTFWRDFFLVTTLFVVIGGVSAAPPYFIRLATNELNNRIGGGALVVLTVLAFAGCWTLSGILDNAKGAFSAAVLTRADAALHRASLRNLLQQTVVQQRGLSAGQVWPNVMRTINGFASVTTSVFWTILPFVFEVAITLVLLCRSLDWKFGAGFAVAVALLTYLAYVVARRSTGIHQRLFIAENMLQQDFIERYGFLYDIKLNLGYAKESETHSRKVRSYIHTVVAVNRELAVRLVLQAVAFGLVLSGFSLCATRMTVDISTRGGDFVMTATYLSLITARLRILAGTLINLEKDLAALAQGTTYLAAPAAKLGKEFENENSVVFKVRQVRLSEFSEKISEPIDFEIPLGYMTAIAGPSGIGKSSLLNAMLGITAVQEGEIEFFGQKVKEGDHNQILKRVAVAPQTPRVFEGTLRENLTFGVDSQVEDAFLCDVVSKLELQGILRGSGSETLSIQLGLQGQDLSGGERQRISVARALVREREVLILDEPTSALDARLIDHLMEYVQSRSKTIIVISHDPRVLARADLVIQLGQPIMAEPSIQHSK